MMEAPVRNSLWHVLRADTGEARQARQRLGALIAFAVFVGGLLIAAGLAVVVLATSLAVVVLVGGVSALRALRSRQDQLRRSGRFIARHTTGLLRAALRLGNVLVARATRVPASVGPWVARRWEAIARHAPRKDEGLQDEALRLNVAGTKHRRSGEYSEAIALHTRALELLSNTSDAHAVALTQNNLALAMSYAGDDGAATSLFEDAAATVRRLGDEELEGRIMANLAVAHRRQGRQHEYEHVLRLALAKLRRDSSAHRRVAAELSRVA